MSILILNLHTKLKYKENKQHKLLLLLSNAGNHIFIIIRGVELLNWHTKEGIHVECYQSGFKIHDIDITDTWCDYDEDIG